MGRWAQASRRGGGPLLPNLIISAVKQGAFNILLTYQRDGDLEVLADAAFETLPEELSVEEKFQFGTRTLQLTMLDAITTETQIVYDGTTPGYLTPQTVDLT